MECEELGSTCRGVQYNAGQSRMFTSTQHERELPPLLDLLKSVSNLLLTSREAGQYFTGRFKLLTLPEVQGQKP